MLEDAYRKGQEQRDQVRQDMETGRARAAETAREASQNMQEAGAGSHGYSEGATRSWPTDPNGDRHRF